MENLLKKYFESYFNDNEKLLFNINFDNNDYIYINDNNWEEVEKEYKDLLNLHDFNMVIGESASYFIHNIFKKHVDNDTFIIGSLVHSTINEEINKSLNKYIITYNDIKNFDTNKLILKFKESNCRKLFIYLPSLIDQELLLQDFCFKLKEELIKQNIEHILVLDDVATMFLIPKDYNIFDYIIYTCHSLIPNFDSGILFYKDNINFGFKDYKSAKFYLIPLKMFLNKKDKIYLFNIMLYQYFSKELSSNLFKLPKYTIPNIFNIVFNDNMLSIIDRHKKELNDYHITCTDKNINIRCSHLISQEIDDIMNGLNKLKNILQKCIKYEKMKF